MRPSSSNTWLRLFWLLLAASVLPIVGAGLVITSWLEATARDDARVRMGSLADLGATLIRQRVGQAEASLAMAGRMLGGTVRTHMDVARNVGIQPIDPIEGALGSIFGSSRAFLDVQVYGNADGASFLGQRVSPELALAQSRTPDLPRYQIAQTVENIGSPAVQRPLQNHVWRSEVVEREFGFPTVRLSAPTTERGEPNGAVVGYLDLRALPEDLQPIADAGCAAQLRDRDGAALGRVQPTARADGPDERILRDVGFGDWTLEVAMPETEILATAAGTRVRVWGWTVGAGLLAALASLLIARRISRPVARLTAAAEAMSAGRLEARAGIDGNDEFGRLGAAFDRMARTVEDLDRARSSFVSTVSHELRTPLTSMKLTLDNVRDGIAGPVPDAVRPALDRVGGDCGRMLTLVDDLLQLTRIDAGVERAQTQAVDLGAMARDVIATLAPIAARAGKNLQPPCDTGGEAFADPNLVRRILTNLCANGIQHSAPQGRVDVGVGHGSVQVVSDGAGLDPERHRAAFARDGERPGSGLGLFLVERLAALQGGRITYETVPGPRTSVTLHLPTSPPIGASNDD